MSLPQRFAAPALALAACAMLAACASNSVQPQGYYPQPYPQQPHYGGQQPAYNNSGYAPAYQNNYGQFGQVVNVEFVRAGSASSEGLTGAMIGGAVGGLAGNQIGGGSGRTAATVAGVVGGALIGRALEQNMSGASSHDRYRVTVRFDDGATRTFEYAQSPNVRVGDRVRADGNQLYR